MLNRSGFISGSADGLNKKEKERRTLQRYVQRGWLGGLRRLVRLRQG